MGGIIQAVGDGGSNRDKSMSVRDAEFFLSIQHSSWYTVGPQEMAAVMISVWKVLRNLK